ncbi:MAG: hypothetical protein L6U16_07255 [Porphyromonadaceae bacterium]|nr:MAG: hypothetical protein L6U16_07255 [Porphyromonadaceae bacterium]
MSVEITVPEGFSVSAAALNVAAHEKEGGHPHRSCSPLQASSLATSQ